MTFNEKDVPSSLDRYAVGAILYLRMRNFLTYKDAFFYPGSGMNMIIGPNGSGKSAFVAGIVLALGAPQSLLDRSSQISEFIRHGCTEASLEIILKGPANKKYRIVRNIKKHFMPMAPSKIKSGISGENLYQMDNIIGCESR